MFFKRFALIFTLFLACYSHSMATHLRAGNITVESDGGRTVTIVIEVYTNTLNTTVLFGGDQDILDFGDGQTELVSPEMQGSTTGPNGPLPPNVNYVRYETQHTYGAPGFYTISYREPNRNEGVLNMDASVNTTFYIETRILIDPSLGETKSPKLTVDPIDRACVGVAFFHNPGAYDPDPGDSISYEMVVPYSNRNTPVINYRDPNDPGFYASYGTGNEAGNGTPTFNINSVTGTLTWDSPGKVGEYNIAFHVVEHRKVNGVWKRIGYVRRDMQILVEDCKNERPTLELPPDTCVIAGTLLEVDVIGKDVDGDPVRIEAYSQIFNDPFVPPATINPNPAPDEFFPVDAVTRFSWQTNCSHVREQPYSVVFKVQDKPPLGPRLATFENWFITVVGPKPVWNSYQKQEADRTVTLNWEPYTCDNAVAMQVWRKVDGSDFQPTNCDTGMPSYLGYELVGTVSLSGGTVTSFTDTNGGAGLEIGPQYCYRLVAVFPAGTRAESLVSDDICVEPFKLTTPVITHVDVDVTNSTSGRVIVKWIEPKENPDYPPGTAFTYRIFRGTGFEGDSTDLNVTTSDLFFEDNNLDTEGTIYNYTVHAYVGDVRVGNSAKASTVRLEPQSRNKRIDLTWDADVPWSNNISGYTHKIYRGAEGADTKDDLQFLAEVNVITEGFNYADLGPLEEKPYCYLVETYGSYGNPLIHTEALINRSQIVCAEPGDDVAPCKPAPPELEEPLNCEEKYQTADGCSGGSNYSNSLVWTKDESECGRDIAFYVIYYSNSETGEYQPLDTVRNATEYVDTKELLNSYARCYKISAVDRSGNESEKSDAFCVDNCPYYELPNVFTPNGDNCNDLFRAYNNVYTNIDENGSQHGCPMPLEYESKCARFVRSVVFHVFNRWGREVYSYTGQVGGSNDAPQDAILINWDGKSNDGRELSTGVYYYVAEVTFITIKPENEHKTLKGWVHLIRDTN